MSAQPPPPSKLSAIAAQAEPALNTYESKTGSGRAKASAFEAAGVTDERTSRRFPGSTLKYGVEYVSNRGDHRRIPPDEGGDVDDRGRYLSPFSRATVKPLC